jgi:organic hydroperoxide reductase OsmC/OhrA
VEGKPDLAGTADPAFRGEMNKHNPEELFLAALSACHMLFYLALCARNGICVVAYEDRAEGQITSDSRGGGRFESITLRPHVTVGAKGRVELARSLHGTAHERCFIANSCSVPIRIVSAVEER